MNTKDIEEIVGDFTRRISSISEPDTLLAYDQQEEIDMQSNWLRTTLTELTTNHEAEVQRAYERGYKQGKFDKEMDHTYAPTIPDNQTEV